ncbi:MAG: phage tail tape measure protein [Ruminococcaceae bacterium]|nr:phage tail tape measure protein [Oscillospiraceae bacterium]
MADKLGVGKAFGAITAAANPATLAITATAGVMIAAGKAAGDFEVHLDALQALTGVTDETMKGLSDTTLQMSKKFGLGAGEIADSMGLIGSQAPELLKDTDALATVTDAAMTLAKAGSISAEAAGKAITTVTNQLGVSASEAMNIANTLEAAEQQGAASVEYLNKAIEKSGTQAKAAGMSYVDLAAMIETVAPKFSSADVAGSQLNSTLLKLSMGADEFNPAVVGMSQALQNLSDAQLTNEQLSKMVGEANITMVKAMIEGKTAFDDFSVSLSGTSAAVDAWMMKTDNMAGKIDKLKATWDAFLITLGQSGLIQGIADNIMLVMEALGEVINIITDVIDTFDLFGESGVDNTTILRAQLDILIGIIKGVGEVLKVIIAIAAKVFNSLVNTVKGAADWIGDRWNQLKKQLGDVAFVKFVINAFNRIMEKVGSVINKIKEWWANLKKSLGLSVEATAKVDTKTGGDATIQSYEGDGGGGSSAPSLGGGTGTKGKRKGKTTTPKVEKVKVEPEEGSIKALQDKVAALNKELTETNVSDERLQQINAEKAALEEQIKALQTRNGLSNKKPDVDEGSIKALQDRVSELNKELNETSVSDDRLKEINAEKSALEEQIKQLQIRNGLAKETPEVDKKRDQYNKANQTIGQVKADFKVGLISKEEATKAIADANAVIQSLGMEPLELHINDDGTITNSLEELQAYQEQMNQTAALIGNVGNAFGSLGDAIGGTGGKVMDFAGQTLNAAAQIIPQVLSIIGAKQAEAMASGTASAAALPFPANLAAMASIMATVVSLFAAIPKTFADGGIVSGSSYHGDSVLARVNSGEMILNKAQQSALYHSLKSGGVSGGMSGNVNFVIEGSKLKGCLSNYDAKQKKIR